jgi:EpsI family protein
VGVLLAALVSLHAVSHGEAVVPRAPLYDLPLTLESWSGEDHPLKDPIIRSLSVTDYVNRFYTQSATPPIQLYIGYYSSQRTGDTIHSPKNCLPGAGWEPVHSGYATISIPHARPVVVNEYVVQQDFNKQMVFYWYQGRGRVIASEYSAKWWMVSDAISRNRTDGALVRINTPINNDEASARERLMRFAEVLFPQLNRLLPN